MVQGLVHGHAVDLLAVAQAEGDRPGVGVGAAGDEGEGDLVLGGVADLLAEAVVGQVGLDPNPARCSLRRFCRLS